MSQPHNPNSPFNWQGRPSIFTTGNWRSAQDFSGTNTNRAAMQTRIEPRPTHLVSDSVYLKQPKMVRQFKSK